MRFNNTPLDKAITQLSIVPRTLTGILLFPGKTFSSDELEEVSSPGVIFAIGLATWAIAQRFLLRIDSQDFSLSLQSSSDETWEIVIFTAALLVAQALILSIFLRAKWDWSISAHLLAYPMGLALFFMGASVLLGIQFPVVANLASDISKFIECNWGSGATQRVIPSYCTRPESFIAQAHTLSMISGMTFYIWGLLNTFRVTLKTTLVNAITLSVLSVAALFIAFAAGNFLVDFTEGQAKALAKSERQDTHGHNQPLRSNQSSDLGVSTSKQ